MTPSDREDTSRAAIIISPKSNIVRQLAESRIPLLTTRRCNVATTREKGRAGWGKKGEEKKKKREKKTRLSYRHRGGFALNRVPGLTSGVTVGFADAKITTRVLSKRGLRAHGSTADRSACFNQARARARREKYTTFHFHVAANRSSSSGFPPPGNGYDKTRPS